MKTKDIVDKLQRFVSNDKGKAKKRITAIEDLLGKLDHKERKYKKRLDETDDKKSRKKLERKLSVIDAQKKKGEAALNELQEANQKAK